MSSKKNRRGVVYSTNPDFDLDQKAESNALKLSADQQLLHVSLDSKQRKGKVVTLIEGFAGSIEQIKALEKLLKTRCGVGGSSKDGVIIVQGPLKQKVSDILMKEGYRVKLKG